MKFKFGSRKQPLPKTQSRFPWPLVLLITLAGAVARGCLLFSTPLVPGMNGAYYLVQARALIEQGKLGIPDLPLTFVLQAILSKLVQLVSGASLESSILFAVKCADAALPPLVAIPVFALVRRWSIRAGAGVWVPACAALAAAAGAPALLMVGDFQKNSLGLVWLAALLLSLDRWFEKPSAKRAALAVLFLALIGVTHIGVFGWALALTVFVMGFALWRSEPQTRRAILPWLFVGGSACALAAGLVLWKFDPARVQRLAAAATHPLTYLHHDQRPGNSPGGQRDAAPPRDSANNFRPAQGPNNFPGGPGMMPGNRDWIPTAALLLASAGALVGVWFRRKNLGTGNIAVVTGCALGLLALSGPWVTGDKVMRFRLIAVGPALICASFALLQLRLPKTRNILAAVMALALVVPGAMRVAHGGRPIITLEAAEELRSMASEISTPAKTLIVARHGLEWWTAWYLHTHIAHANALSEADWKNFDNVYFLRQKGGMQMPFGGGPGPGRQQSDRRFRPDGPPDFARDGFPPPRDFDRGPFPSRGPGGPGGFGGPGGAMGEPPIPPDADITHEGEFFTMALVPTAEGFPMGTNRAYALRP